MSALIIPSRRSFLSGLAAVFAAPAIVRAASLMPVRGVPIDPQAVFNECMSRLLIEYSPLADATKAHMVRYLFDDADGEKACKLPAGAIIRGFRIEAIDPADFFMPPIRRPASVPASWPASHPPPVPRR